MGTSKIEWTDAVWNPVTGCTPVSEGCANCYAGRMAKRLAGRFGYSKRHPFRPTLHRSRLSQPIDWRKPRRVFVCSMGDLFHENVPDEFIKDIWYTMLAAQQHTFQILTKRPQRAARWFETVWDAVSPLRNVWFGVSVEDQRAAEERIPALVACNASTYFVSCEPLLGPVDLSAYLEWGSVGPPRPTGVA